MPLLKFQPSYNFYYLKILLFQRANYTHGCNKYQQIRESYLSVFFSPFSMPIKTVVTKLSIAV